MEHSTPACCRAFVVTVNRSYAHCLAEMNTEAMCVAQCESPPPDWTPPPRTPTCVDGACRLVLEDGTDHQLVIVQSPL